MTRSETISIIIVAMIIALAYGLISVELKIDKVTIQLDRIENAVGIYDEVKK